MTFLCKRERETAATADIVAQSLALVIGILLLGLLSWMIAWRITHPQPEQPPKELTQEERTSLALALAGVAAAGNPSTAIYTPLLLGAASEEAVSEHLRPTENGAIGSTTEEVTK